MSGPYFCLSNDRSLSSALKTRVLTECQTRNNSLPVAITPYSDGCDACRILADQSVSTVFVDLREDWQVEDLEEFLTELEAGLLGHVDLIAIHDGTYPLSLVDSIELFAVHHLKWPLKEEECAEVVKFLRGGGRVNGHRRLPDHRTLNGGIWKLTTYTQPMFAMMDLLERIAPRDVALLLVGETGTGKTTLAQIIHAMSPRQSEPFHDVACGALPPDLIESELFGHKRGAFTSADRDKCGRFDAVGKGTLLLDEIDVLGPKEQVKLLRVIESGQYEPVGSTETRTAKARLLFASNVDLESCVESNQFRSDLYYRLNVLQFQCPPLRERAIDIVPLATQFIRECCEQHGIRIRRVTQEFLSCLKQYEWPGNIRELKNQVHRAVLFNQSGLLQPEDLNDSIRRPGRESIPEWLQDRDLSLAERIAKSERIILEEELRLHDQCRTTTAKTLGISRVGLYKKMKKHGMI